MARYHNETELDPTTLRNVAEDLRDIADEYDQIAREVEKHQLQSIRVESYKSLVRGLKDFESHLVKTYTALTRARRRTPDPEQKAKENHHIQYAAEGK